MHKVIILQGIPGSGKTYFAKNWVLENPEHRVRLNCDDLRNMFGKYWVPSREPVVHKIKENILYHLLDDGYDIVIDNMNLNSAEINKLSSIIHVYPEYNIEFKNFFDVSLETCIERDSLRDNPIGKDTITEIYNKYKEQYGFK